MKYEITHLKAPWPDGAKVGDVFEAGDGPVPAWALGKVRSVHDDAKATIALPRRKPLDGEITGGSADANTPVSREQFEAETIEQQAQRERDELEARGRQAAEQQAQREQLEIEAEALELKVDKRWGLDRLTEEVTKAKAEAAVGTHKKPKG